MFEFGYLDHLEDMKYFLPLLLCAGCAQIPEQDQNWLDRKQFVGETIEVVENSLAARGFAESTWFNYERVVEKRALGPIGGNKKISNWVGFTSVSAPPSGLSGTCYSKTYTVVFGSGDRLICVAQSEGVVRWIEAGWIGVTL